MTLTRTAVLLLAVIATGLIAGLFYTFAIAVMPALNQADDRTFVVAMQRINVAILNPWFLICFLGALLLTALAGVFTLLADSHGVLPWIIAAFVLYLAMFIITAAINVPLNNELEAAGNTDLAAVRARFEATWVGWNVVRALTSTAAFGCLAWALVAQSRTG
ncbi:MAG: hypothetical protein JWQ81_5402 [Amycolatopsis sp.]|jgi:uncharacterized membrane protein|uniref:anthrone oxygenase family protein n=1 Tax=Amycolatopsis sp. TaxID=37632 RepID=UPI002611A665|nr:anthrone oxygenase family protein [Amycolatopsis sp.]MCU1684663.1 hypothetical protein [Amycolatopsis sp.]